jgi:hypothetical protein
VSAAEEDQRYQALGPGQGTVMANHSRLARVEVALEDADRLTRGRDHVPDAGTDAVQDSWAEPARLDRLLAGDDPHLLAEHRPPRLQDVGLGAVLGVDVAGAGLAG